MKRLITTVCIAGLMSVATTVQAESTPMGRVDNDMASSSPQVEECCGVAQVNQCYRCHQTTSWNDIRGIGYYKMP